MSFDSTFPQPDFPDANREHELASDHFAAPVDRLSDDWLDEALRSVPLPGGFLTRMSVLAQNAEVFRFDPHGRFSTPR
jgi:hypothetical protein